MKPDKPLTLEDIRKIQADYYEGTPYDMTKGPAAGPWGNPIRYVNRGGKGSFERSINVQRTYYLHIGAGERGAARAAARHELVRVRRARHLVPDAALGRHDELPALPRRGDRYGVFDRESGFWTNIYVQQMAELHYNEAIKHVQRRARAAAEDALRGHAEGAGAGGADVREGPEGGRQHAHAVRVGQRHRLAAASG